MDVLRKELDELYHRQYLSTESLPEKEARIAEHSIDNMSQLSGICCVLTDIAADSSYVAPSQVGKAIGLSENELQPRLLDSSDEDFLYARIHPADLVDLRMLEYEFFSFVDQLSSTQKLEFKAVANVRMKNREGAWMCVSKSTQITRLSPRGKFWLILCTYDILSSNESINPRIINMATGDIRQLSFAAKKINLLTAREKELLRLVSLGKLSKEIAKSLGISIHTVNRHRQNILEKLSVDNSMEAVNAATAMGLI